MFDISIADSAVNESPSPSFKLKVPIFPLPFTTLTDLLFGKLVVYQVSPLQDRRFQMFVYPVGEVSVTVDGKLLPEALSNKK